MLQEHMDACMPVADQISNIADGRVKKRWTSLRLAGQPMHMLQCHSYINSEQSAQQILTKSLPVPRVTHAGTHPPVPFFCQVARNPKLM